MKAKKLTPVASMAVNLRELDVRAYVSSLLAAQEKSAMEHAFLMHASRGLWYGVKAAEMKFPFVGR